MGGGQNGHGHVSASEMGMGGWTLTYGSWGKTDGDGSLHRYIANGLWRMDAGNGHGKWTRAQWQW